MSGDLTGVVLDLFKRYESYAQKLDFKAVARLYSSKLVAAGPGGLAFYSNNRFTRWQFDRAMKRHYKRMGLTGMHIVSSQETIISDQFSMALVTWAASFQKTGDHEILFQNSYLIRKTPRGAEVVLFITHEDEATVLERHGLGG